MPNKVTAAKVVKNIEAASANKKLVEDATRNAITMYRPSVFRKEDGKNRLTTGWVFDELVDDIA
jgi:hypothetical protein